MNKAESKSVVLLALHECLKPLGFRKSGAKFIRSQGDVVHFIELQSSRTSTAQELIVTVNVGVFAPSLLYPESTQLSKPSWSECHWTERLGHLCPEHKDLWWTITSPESATLAAGDITHRIKEFALPALARLESVASLVALWRSGRGPGLTKGQRIDLLAYYDAGAR